MDITQLSVDVRTQQGKGAARKIRARGKIPGILYGKNSENILLEVDPKAMQLAISGTSGMNTVLEMNVPSKGKITVMLKDYQADNIRRQFTHLDFVRVDLTKKIHIEVPVEFVGKAEGVKEGGILEIIRRELPVVCLPTAIPKSIEVDVSALKVGSSIHIDDIKLPAGIEVPHEENFTVVSVVMPKEEEVAPAAAAPTEPEVLTAKKPAEGEEPKADGKPEAKKEGK